MIQAYYIIAKPSLHTSSFIQLIFYFVSDMFWLISPIILSL
jgi:hypothetical protein